MNAILLVLSFALAVAPSAGASAAAPDARFVAVPYASLQCADATLPSPGLLTSYVRGDAFLGLSHVLAAELADGEAYLDLAPGADGGGIEVVASTRVAGDLHAVLTLPTHEDPTVGRFAVTLPAAAQQPVDAERFESARGAHYARLAAAGLPGAAWFRHRAAGHAANGVDPRLDQTVDDLAATFDLFSGARSLAENLRLETQLRTDSDAEATVAVDSIAGIETKAFDFAPLLAGREPALDPLAAFIPADQHAVFFPSFPALVAVKDELERLMLPVARMLDERAVDALTLERLETQLCLPLSELSRRFGPLLIEQAALTGSDPFLRSGSDVALLLKARSDAAELIEKYWRANAGAASHGAVKEVAAGPLPYAFARSADRAVSAYLLRRGDVILVTNSPVQVDAFAAALSGSRPALAAADDYRFFRDRYPLGEAGAHECALIVLPDAAIRRWCSPRWRIGDSRRVRALARLADQRAAQVEALIADPKASLAEPLDPVYGSFAFATPIAELPIERCTPAEAEAYARFRDTYQRGFRAFFDPIAIRLAVDDEAFDFDVTVMPLIADSDLRSLIEVCSGKTLPPGAGRPHAEALAQFVIAIDPKAEVVHGLDDFFRSGSEELVDPLSWVGDWITFYFDEDPWFEDVAAADDPEEFVEEHVAGIPFAFEVAVKDPLRAGLFMTSLRLLSEQTVPGLLSWENVEHAGRKYVRVKADRSQSLGGGFDDVVIHYAIDGTRLIVTPNERIVRRCLEGKAAEQAAPRRWLGDSVAFHVDERALTFLDRVVSDHGYADQARRNAARALPILEEWKRLFPGEDPVAFHERIFHERLVCPAGGEFKFDPERRTMTTTLLGDLAHPVEPKERIGLLRGWTSVDLGLTFEHDGVRARGRVER